jgi:DNA-binding transcriptional ArsR family regulator
MDIEGFSVPELAAAFKALGDPTRLRIFQTLRCCRREVEIDEGGLVRPAGALSVGEVCCELEQSLSTVSHHLRELRLAGLIRMERRGRSVFCSVDRQALRRIEAFAGAADLEGASPEAGVCCER